MLLAIVLEHHIVVVLTGRVAEPAFVALGRAPLALAIAVEAGVRRESRTLFAQLKLPA